MSRLVVTHLPASPRAPWLEARRADVTASEVAALYGRHKYLTRLQLAYNKIYGERDSGGKPDVAKRRGNILEPACAAAVELDHGLVPRKVRHYLRGRDPTNPLIRVGATLDYEIDADGGAVRVDLEGQDPARRTSQPPRHGPRRGVRVDGGGDGVDEGRGAHRPLRRRAVPAAPRARAGAFPGPRSGSDRTPQ